MNMVVGYENILEPLNSMYVRYILRGYSISLDKIIYVFL